MATLTGTTIQSTYDSLLKVTDNDAITSTLKRITDGLGNNTPLYLSSSAVEITSGLNVIGSLTASNVSGSNTGDETKASIETKLGAATSSNNGYLTSGDWSTFNNKIAGSGTLNRVSKFSSTGSISDSNITDNGTLVSISTATTITGNLTATNIIRSGGTSSQFLKADGSVDSTSYQPLLTNPVTGTGTTNTLPKFTGASAIGNSNITDSGTLITLGSNTTISSGGLGIGTSSLTDTNFRVTKNITGATTAYNIISQGAIQSDVTSIATYYYSASSTQATAFTIGSVRHFHATQGTIGAGSAITTQVGFLAESTLIGATNNYGFRGIIPSGTGRWNLYMDGTANNYLAGSLGIGTTNLTGEWNLRVSKSLVGAGGNTFGIGQDGQIQSSATSNAFMYYSMPTTQATSFTLPNLYHYAARQGSLGAGSAITNQYGFWVENSLTGATNNYGFFGNIASGTNRWNLFMSGTARNFLAGTTSIGSQTDNGTGALLQVAGGITYTNIFNRRALNYTLTLADQNDIVEMNVGSANTVTVPTNASVAFPIGTEIAVMQYGSGQTTIVASAGVTIRSKSSYTKIADQYTGATLVKVGTDEWYLVGNLTA